MLEELQRRVDQILVRNSRVEREKAWETSTTRLISIMFLTYCTVLLVFLVADVDAPWFSACIPTLGFYLSTQSLPVIKHYWMKKYFGKEE